MNSRINRSSVEFLKIIRGSIKDRFWLRVYNFGYSRIHLLEYHSSAPNEV